MTSQRDLFAGFERGRGVRRRGFSPRVDVYYVDKPPRAVVKVDLAAVDPADVALEIRGRQLVIAGERRPRETGGRLYQQIEIEHGPFRRIVELGADVVADDATASYADGVLQVEIPLAAPEQTVRRVPISDR